MESFDEALTSIYIETNQDASFLSMTKSRLILSMVNQHNIKYNHYPSICHDDRKHPGIFDHTVVVLNKDDACEHQHFWEALMKFWL